MKITIFVVVQRLVIAIANLSKASLSLYTNPDSGDSTDDCGFQDRCLCFKSRHRRRHKRVMNSYTCKDR
jgi:hypothetical protein